MHQQQQDTRGLVSLARQMQCGGIVVVRGIHEGACDANNFSSTGRCCRRGCKGGKTKSTVVEQKLADVVVSQLTRPMQRLPGPPTLWVRARQLRTPGDSGLAAFDGTGVSRQVEAENIPCAHCGLGKRRWLRLGRTGHLGRAAADGV